MRFLMYWHESIKMLRWTELKALVLDSIKTFVKSLILITKYFWWLPILGIGSEYFSKFLLLYKQSAWLDIYNFLNHNLYFLGFPIIFLVYIASYFCIILPILFIWITLSLVLYLTTRFTNETKDFSYYLKYSNNVWILFPIITLSSMVAILIYDKTSIAVLKLMPRLYFSFVDISVFFFFDSNRKIITSISRGFYFVFYFLPVLIVVQSPLIVSDLLRLFLEQPQILKAHPYLEIAFTTIAWLISSLISLSISATLYAKIKDKYPDLFYDNTRFILYLILIMVFMVFTYFYCFSPAPASAF